MRLFAALPLHPTAHDRLLQLRLRLSSPKDGLRWSEPEQWYLMLLFFGDVSEECKHQLVSGILALQALAPTLVLTTTGTFPGKGIFYAELEKTPSLLGLQREMLHQAQLAGLKPESRPFHPHITLARSKNKVGHTSLRRFTTPEPPSVGTPVRWSSPELLLLQSTLETQGAAYSIEATKELVEPDADDGQLAEPGFS